MKKYGNLYEDICKIENIRLAHLNAKKGKSHYKEVRMVESTPEKYYLKIKDMLQNKTFRNSNYKMFIRKDQGKRREIFKLPYFPDRIVHHCIVQVLGPIWMKTLINDTWASLKGRGIHKGVQRIKYALRDKDATKYCLKMDVKKFYPSIDHDVLKKVIAQKIKDKDVLWLLGEIIDSAKGVPIGNYLSQHFGNLYLSPFDHWMKEDNHCKYYYRYCDDIVVLLHSKNRLHELRERIEAYLMDLLKLRLNKNWQVFPVDARGIDFLGYRFFHGYSLLRKKTAHRFKKRIRFIKANWQRLPGKTVYGSAMSYYGWLKHANCLNLTRKHFDNEMQDILATICRRDKINNPLLKMAL